MSDRRAGSRSATAMELVWGKRLMAVGRARPKAAVTTAAWTGRRTAGNFPKREVFSMKPMMTGGMIRIGAGKTILVRAVSKMAKSNKKKKSIKSFRPGKNGQKSGPFLAASVEFARWFPFSSVMEIPVDISLLRIRKILQVLAVATAGYGINRWTTSFVLGDNAVVLLMNSWRPPATVYQQKKEKILISTHKPKKETKRKKKQTK